MPVTRRSRLAQGANDDRGGVIVMVAVALGTLMTFAILAIEVGNWFEHRRHLQVQVDAGTLAGAGLFRRCFSGGDAGSMEIEAEARRYAGANPGSYNQQIGGTNKGEVTILLNSRTYAVGGPSPDDTVEAPPCNAGMIDLKATEAGLPSFFGTLGSIVPAINTRARAQLFLVSTRAGNLPLAVPDNDVQAGEVRFVDEDTGAQLGSAPLSPAGVVDGLSMWTTPDPVNVQVGPANRNIGMRVVLSGDMSLDCESLLTECLDASRDNGGLVYLRGWSAAGSGTPPDPPIARRVSLFPVAGDCASSAFFSNLRPCTRFGVRATIDMATVRNNDEIRVFGGDCGNTGCKLEYDSDSGDWVSTGNAGQAPWIGIPIRADDRIPIRLRWERGSGVTITGYGTCANGAANPCKDFFEGGADMHRTFGGELDLSGAVKFAEVTSESTGLTVDSLQLPASGTTSYSLNAAIGTVPSFVNAAGPEAPEVALRVMRESDEGGNSSSRNRSIDCDPDWPNLRQELANGCRPQYTKNSGTPCTGDFGHAALWDQLQPWPCVKVETGGAAGQVTQGVTDRILQGGTCDQHPSNWSSYPNLPSGDTRIVSVILTSFGALSGQGQGTVPVTGFASFYVTAWPELGNNRKERAYCPADRTVNGVERPVPKGYVLGRFINNVDDFNSGGGDEPCPFLDPDHVGIGSCVAVLTD